MSVKPIRDGFHTITPYLFVRNTPGLIEFLSAAFGGELISRMSRLDGTVMHAEMRIGDLMLDERRRRGRVCRDAGLDLFVCAGLQRGLQTGAGCGRNFNLGAT